MKNTHHEDSPMNAPELSVWCGAEGIAGRSSSDDLNEAERPRAQLFEQSEFWALSAASSRSSWNGSAIASGLRQTRDRNTGFHPSL